MNVLQRVDTRIPVVLVAGLPGSGKTAWLNRVLNQPGLADSLVIADPFSVAALTHPLVAPVQDDDTPAPEGGCLCCTLRQDLVRTLVNALWRFSRDGKRQFRRVFIETGGAADPAAIVEALRSVLALARSYRPLEVVTLVNGATDAGSLLADPVSHAQVAAAQRLVLNPGRDALRAALERVCPGVPVVDSACVYASLDD